MCFPRNRHGYQMTSGIKIFFMLTTVNRGFVGYNEGGCPAIWDDRAFRDFDELVAGMLIAPNRISYVKRDDFAPDAPWREGWQEVADNAVMFCKAMLDHKILLFRESTLFVTFPFWRKILLQCGLKSSDLTIIYPCMHPFFHFAHLRNQDSRGLIFRPIHSYSRSVLEQINRFAYVLSNLGDERVLAFSATAFMHTPDTYSDMLAPLVGSSAVSDIIIQSLMDEKPYIDELALMPVSSNPVADEFLKIQAEFYQPPRFDYPAVIRVYDRAGGGSLREIQKKYRVFFEAAAKSECDDKQDGYVFGTASGVDYDYLFKRMFSDKESGKL